MAFHPQGLLLAIILSAGATTAAEAQSAAATRPNVCTEGRLLSGECVAPSVAQVARRRALILAQPKFSYSAPNRLPIDDFDPAVPRPHIEDLNKLYKDDFGF